MRQQIVIIYLYFEWISSNTVFKGDLDRPAYTVFLWRRLHWDRIQAVRRTRFCHDRTNSIHKKYYKCYGRVRDIWEETTVKEMTISGKHEAELHLERGDIDENGILL
ncbi:hypothetical protein PR048_020165 [Dryococelus australis]|uniref:Uncharacterized protein n=1 Tax=Dryococelus australis TaxID=614101 RepID=A0ABQ9H5I5_9NEOP|nr:hypothetical protein PR048_020165 [Dryococelus australis]